MAHFLHNSVRKVGHLNRLKQFFAFFSKLPKTTWPTFATCVCWFKKSDKSHLFKTRSTRLLKWYVKIIDRIPKKQQYHGLPEAVLGFSIRSDVVNIAKKRFNKSTPHFTLLQLILLLFYYTQLILQLFSRLQFYIIFQFAVLMITLFSSVQFYLYIRNVIDDLLL